MKGGSTHQPPRAQFTLTIDSVPGGNVAVVSAEASDGDVVRRSAAGGAEWLA